MTSAKKIAVTGLKGLGWLLLALLVLALAWLACNNRWVDAREAPVPAALQVPAPAQPAERNGFFALLGLDAPAGQEPAAAGRRRWAAQGIEAEEPGRLHWPTPGREDPASSWNCRAAEADCLALWQSQAPALRALMHAQAPLGERCEALAAPGFAMDEPLREPAADLKSLTDQYAVRAILPMKSWGQCGQWLRVQVALAQQAGNAAALQEALQRSQRYVDGLLGGARSLAGNLVAWRVADEHWQLLVAVAARQPSLAPALAKMATPLPAAAQDASRWMVAEAFFGRQVHRELAQRCAGPQAGDDCPLFGLMPHDTQQLLERQWLRALELARGGPLALLDWQPQPEGWRPLPYGLAWRNTMGHALVDVAMPNFPDYGRRQADLLLRHQATLLALQVAGQPTAQRTAWLAAQPLDERLRARLRLEGAQLIASPWSTQGEAAKPLRYPLSPPQDS